MNSYNYNDDEIQMIADKMHLLIFQFEIKLFLIALKVFMAHNYCYKLWLYQWLIIIIIEYVKYLIAIRFDGLFEMIFDYDKSTQSS